MFGRGMGRGRTIEWCDSIDTWRNGQPFGCLSTKLPSSHRLDSYLLGLCLLCPFEAFAIVWSSTNLTLSSRCILFARHSRCRCYARLLVSRASAAAKAGKAVRGAWRAGTRVETRVTPDRWVPTCLSLRLSQTSEVPTLCGSTQVSTCALCRLIFSHVLRELEVCRRLSCVNTACRYDLHLCTSHGAAPRPELSLACLLNRRQCSSSAEAMVWANWEP
mmetsp:Transcript_46566/g.76956  ORF Transcript_46566/g.76956 Transcript_46566/m.76956 type:complete len:218 (-) Transcript_46566:859-1512(-)